MPKVYMDSCSGEHLTERICQHFPNPDDQKKMANAVKKLLTMSAPTVAVGQYKWYVNVGRLGRIILRGHSIRTVYPLTYTYPGGKEYRVSRGKLVRV